MAKKRKVISEFEYRDMQVAYAFQLFREGFTARQVQEKLNIPSNINLAAMARTAIEGVL
uniref:Uncharacterized protein n=1 Tax=Salmonella phage vB_SEnST11_KE22 TaxID=3161173 RepID=A0AAU8GE79_9CAUD